ncbi:MAG: hypothetical protein N4A33_04430 [Bacteriovoracaceae bacterium]|jgi:hypothetical protein|nr:hypothetical protein [Bacteriovoracaceae bacterium]
MTKLLFLSLTLSLSAFSQYYKTLPKGARTLVYRNINTANIKSSYNHSNTKSPYTFQVEATGELLQDIEIPEIQLAISEMNQYIPSDQFSLGTYKVSGSADVQAEVFGVGYGITNKVTAYVGIPLFDARVKMKYSRPKGNTYSALAEALEESTTDNVAQGASSLIASSSKTFDFDATILQNILTNELDYEPLGDWNGSGMGDVELGILYNFYTANDYGLLFSTGAVAPTGRVDDPDILQDFGFGDGQWDMFLEFGGSYHISAGLTFNSYMRYTYQFASEKELRRPISNEIKESNEKGIFNEKLGNKHLYHFDLDYSFNDWISFKSGYEYEYIGTSKYDSAYGIENKYLAYNSDSSTHTLNLGLTLSTITLFQKQKFVLPASIELKTSQMFSGTNNPDVDRYELEFRMFF